MLFVISTNQKKLDNTSVSGSVVTETEEKTDELNNLIDKLSEEDTDEKNKEDTEEGEAMSDSDTMKLEESDDWEKDTEKEKGGFLDFFKKGKKDDKEEKEDSMEETAMTGSQTNPSGSLIKNTANVANTASVESQYAFQHVEAIELPGVNLVTEVGKTFEIGVHSLKLNNKYFNQTLGYMLEGDTVKQLTEENSRGCFQVEVTSSKTTTNTGKIGYVCKKYLTEAGAKTLDEEEIIPDVVTHAEDVVGESLYYTPVISIALKDATYTENITVMETTDVLRQISAENEDGCFQVRIVGSNIESNHFLEGYVCHASVTPYTGGQ